MKSQDVAPVATSGETATSEQRAAIAFPPAAGNVFVGAGPGSGKTFLLVERYRFLRECGVPAARLLVLTFSRRAAAEITDRLGAAGYARAELDVRTFHGFAARVLGGGVAQFRSGRLLDGLSRAIVLDAAIGRTPTSALRATVRESRAFRAELQTLIADLSRAPHTALSEVAAAASPRLRDVVAIARAAAAARATIGGNEIGDLVSRAVDALGRADSPATRWIAGRYAHVLVDEFQDTDRVQIELLAALDAAIFAVGDEAQSIYRFRGAGNEIVPAARERFGMRRFDLTRSRRCPPDVCALAARTPIPGLAPLESARHSGEPVAFLRFRAVDDEVVAIADIVESDLNAGVPAEQIAVLLRAFRPLGPLLVDELRRRAIAVAAIEREELLGDPRVATLRAALGVLDRPSDAARWSRLLTAGPLGFDPLHVRFALSAAAAPAFDATLGPALDAICSGGSLTGPELAAALAWAAQAWSTGDIGRAARRLVRRLRLLAAVMRDEPPSRVRAAAARLRVVCDALAAGARTTAGLGLPSDCADVLARFDEHLPALALDDAGLDPDAPGVRILTVHAAKGLEFERVFVADAVAGRFPQDARASGLLDERDRAVLARCGCDGPSVHPEAAALEEAALWYVALTRCKERLTITFSDRALDGEVQRPSRFIPFAARPAIVAPVERESIELRTLRCGDAAARARLLAGAALDGAPALADFARLGWAAFAPLDGYPLQRTRALAVGDAELWLQCPRRLFYRRFARLPDDPSATRELGSTLHAVLERFHALRTDFAPEAIDVAEWTRELLALRSNGWVAAAYESELVANAAAMAADVALRSYARALGERARLTPFRVEARELEITVPVDPTGPAALAGRIDRLDTLPDGSRVVVDYKLGHAKHQTAGAAVARQVAAWRAADGEQRKRAPLARNITGDLRLQLGFYASALDRVAAVAYIFLGGAASAPKRDGAVHEIAAYDDAFRAVVSAALGEIAAGLVNPLAVGTLRSFPVTHEADNCLHCPYTAVCPGPADRDK